MYVLMNGPASFSEVLAGVPELSDRLLSERLKELEEAGIVSRQVVPARPPSVRYELTDKGVALRPVLDVLGSWIEVWESAPA